LENVIILSNVGKLQQSATVLALIHLFWRNSTAQDSALAKNVQENRSLCNKCFCAYSPDIIENCKDDESDAEFIANIPFRRALTNVKRNEHLRLEKYRFCSDVTLGLE